MKVKELIAKLQEYDGELEVLVNDFSGWGYNSMNKVREEEVKFNVGIKGKLGEHYGKYMCRQGEFCKAIVMTNETEF